jgi:hypothetical protein
MNSNDPVFTTVPIVDSVLDQYATALGHDFVAYRNHVYRVLNLSVAIAGSHGADLEKAAIASVFHDLGIWTDHTFDYIAPSVSLAREHLASHSRADWIPEIEATIVNHHKITRAPRDSASLVEAFRRADWIDVSRGVRRFGVARTVIESLFAKWPSAGFHWRLVELAAQRFRHHPLTPLPMIKL